MVLRNNCRSILPLESKTQNNLHTPLILSRDAHNLSRSNISEPALKVLYRLKKANHDAYLVGGGVRDLLLGRHPKDFDIVTDALPEDAARCSRTAVSSAVGSAWSMFILVKILLKWLHSVAMKKSARMNPRRTDIQGMVC